MMVGPTRKTLKPTMDGYTFAKTEPWKRSPPPEEKLIEAKLNVITGHGATDFEAMLEEFDDV